MILIVGGTFQGKKAFAEKLLNEKREILRMAQAVLFRIFTMQKCCFISMSISEECWSRK